MTTAEKRTATAVQLEKLRAVAWYRKPRYARLFGLIGMGVVLAAMTGEQGSTDDVNYALEHLYKKPLGLIVWVALGVTVWALGEFARPFFAKAEPGVEAVKKGAVRFNRRRGELGRKKWPKGLNWLKSFKWKKLGKPTFGLAVTALLVCMPLILSRFWNEVLVSEVAIYVLIAIGLNVVVGWAGLLDLGFIAFFAIGAYSTAYWTGSLPVQPPFTLNPFLTIPITIVTCLLAGLILGAPTLRLRGDYLAIVTLGFHEIIFLIAQNAEGFTGGVRGVKTDVPHFSIDLGFWDYKWGLNPKEYWWLILVLAGILIFAFRRLEHSRIGRAWTAVREDEVAAAANGVDTVRMKLLAFSIGAATSGLGGVVYASKTGFFSPLAFILMFSVLVLSYVIFGGMGSLWGVIIGTAFLAWLPQYLKDIVDPKDRFMYLGALLVIMMIYRPQGLIPSKRRKRELTMAKAGLGDADAMSEPVGGRVA